VADAEGDGRAGPAGGEGGRSDRGRRGRRRRQEEEERVAAVHLLLLRVLSDDASISLSNELRRPNFLLMILAPERWKVARFMNS